MDALARLSEAEKRTLRVLAAQGSPEAAAAALCVAESTVNTHLANARHKLGYNKTWQAIVWLLLQEIASLAPAEESEDGLHRIDGFRGRRRIISFDEGVPSSDPESRSQFHSEPPMPTCLESERTALPDCRQRLRDTLLPHGPVEEHLVNEIAHLEWELDGLDREEREVADRAKQAPPANAEWRVRFAEQRSRLVELEAKAYGHLLELQGERGQSRGAGKERVTRGPGMRREREARE